MTLLGSSSGCTASGPGEPGSPFLSRPQSPRGYQADAARPGRSWPRPAEAGPGWERDRPLRRAGTSGARGGGAQGSSPGAGVAAPAAGSPAAAASAPAAARRRGRARPGRAPPLRLQPRRGRRSPSRSRAEPPAEPCPRPCSRRAGPPLAESVSPPGPRPRGRRFLAGKGEVPAPQSFGGDCWSLRPGPAPPGATDCLPRRLPPRRPPPCAPLAPPAPGDPRPPPVLEPPLPARGARPGLAQGLRWLNLYTVSMYCLSFRALHDIVQKSGKPGDLGSSAATASGQLSE